MSPSIFEDVSEIGVASAILGGGAQLVYEHGWQSWSPTGAYRPTDSPHRPADRNRRVMCYRSDRSYETGLWQGDGLLAVELPDVTHVWAADAPFVEVPTINARSLKGAMVVSASGPVTHSSFEADLPSALEHWAESLVEDLRLPAVDSHHPGWCSWYCYWNEVSEQDIVDNLAAIERHDLDVEVVQIDDGYQAEIGDWLELSDRFSSLQELAQRIKDTGRRAGIWTAPLLVGSNSRVAREHPDWLVQGAFAGHHWGQDLLVLDPTHPDGAEHLAHVFHTLVSWGFDYHKVDFLYGGALQGGRHADVSSIEAYRHGIEIIRNAIGPEATLLGCGAPILPSIGLFDIMRTSPDVGPRFEPPDGDMSQPSVRAALATGRARAFMHARFWANDPDCLIVRPAVERRGEWAEHVASSGGIVVSSDPLAQLDNESIARIQGMLRDSTTEPVSWDPNGPDQGRIIG